MNFFHKTVGLTAFLLVAEYSQAENNGQDVTQPLTRFDVRVLQTESIYLNEDDNDADATTTILRIDKPMFINEAGGWMFYYRTDVPFVYSDVPSRDNPQRSNKFGLGDWFNQFVFIAPSNQDYPLGIDVWALGFQVILDTASQDQMGEGRNAFAPLVAWKWNLNEKTQLIPIFKYRHHISGSGSGDRAEIERFEFKPQFNMKFDDGWFVTLYDTADWTYQMSEDSSFENEWNIPLDVMVGKTTNACPLVNRCVYSFNVITNLIDDYERNDYQAQLRIGLFF